VHFTSSGEPRSTAASSSSSSSSSVDEQDPLPGLNPVSLLQVCKHLGLHCADTWTHRVTICSAAALLLHVAAFVWVLPLNVGDAPPQQPQQQQQQAAVLELQALWLCAGHEW
jgi:hypothetical protein